MSHRNLAHCVLVAICLLLFSQLGRAQFRASIRGTVTDPQGGAVAGATVTLENTDTGQKLVSTSDTNGIYEFNALSPSPYKLTAEAPGFKTKVLEKVAIIPEQPNALNLQLDVGEVQQTVTVSGTTQALDTDTATLSGTITSNQIQHMPSFGRDVMQLVQLAPGMTGDGAQGSGGGGENVPGSQGPGATGGSQGIFQTENGPQALAVGQQYENNSISIDGISTTSAVWGGTTIVTPSEDSVDSVKVVSNSYDAENGRFSGAQIQVTSKSGSNDFHGSAFFTAHRPGLNAFQRFNGLGNAVLRDENRFNQLGGGIGGPIWKNKIFFFFNVETIDEPNAGVTSTGWYDTPAFDALARPGSIAAQYLSFPGNGVVSQGSINPATCANIGLVEGVNCRTIPGQGLNLGSPLTTPLGTHDLTWSSPSSPGVGSGLSNVADIANYTTVSKTTSSKYQYNGRLDANLTQLDHIAFAIYWVPQDSTFLNGASRTYNLFHHNQINEAFSVVWNHTFSPTVLNEFRTNLAGWHWNEISSNPQQPVGLPLDNIDQIGSLTGSNAVQPFGAAIGSILNQWTGTIKDVATQIAGRHSIKYGFDVTRLFYLNECAGCGVPNYNFFNLWDFLNDAPHKEGGNFNPANGAPTINKQDDRQNIWGVFIQDDFKVRQNLTLNLGLRGSYFGALSDTQGNLFIAYPGAGSNFLTGLTVRDGESWRPQWNNLGPQLGFAWSPSLFKDKLVVRGGYGLNYNQEEIALSANVGGNPGLVVSPTFTESTPTSPNPGIVYAIAANVHSLTSYPVNPNTISAFGPNGLPASGAQVNVTLFPYRFPTTRVHHYSVDAQYDLGHNWIAMLGYQGTLSRNINFHEDPNAVPAALGYALNPQIGGGDYWNLNGYGHYNAMIADVKHQFGQQFSAETQFTWSKCIDTSSGPYYEQPYPYNLRLDEGRCDYNISKAFKLFGTWQPILFHGSKNWAEKIVGGWTISGIFNIHSGFPWSPVTSVINGSLYCSTCNYTTLFPAAYLGGAGSSTSNDQFKTGSNYPKGGTAYFSIPTYTPFSSGYGSALPQSPGVARNSLNGPDYRDVDLTVSKGFGLPKLPILGENARFEFRVDAYNVFNLLNFNPATISNNIANSNFGQDTAALAARVITMGARFSF